MSGKPIQASSATSDLSSAALDYDLSIDQENVELLQVMLNASENITETVTVTLESAFGASTYTFVLDTSSLSGASNYVFRPTGNCVMKRGDNLNVACTNANTTGIVYVVVQVRETV